jgi:NNP family nitrate/nitrite transporter-like MFS transporter
MPGEPSTQNFKQGKPKPALYSDLPGQITETDLHPSAAQNPEIQPFRARLPAISLLAFLFFFNFLARFIWGPLLVEIETDLGISHTGAGSLFFYITAGYFFGLLGSGYLSARLNHYKTITISSLTCGLAMIAAAMGASLVFLRMVLILIGLTAGFYLPSGIASLTYRLDSRNFAKAFSIHEISPSVGFIVAPLIAEAMRGWSGWRATIWPIAAGLMATGLLYARKGPTGEYKGDQPTWQNMRHVLSQRAFWMMLGVFALGVAANVGVFSMIPLYLQTEKGMGPTFSNYIMSASRMAAIGSPMITGWLSSRFQARLVMAAVTLLSGISTTLVGIAGHGWLWIPLLLQPVFATAFFPPGYAVLTEMVASGRRSLIIALIMPVSMLLGGGAFPTFIGVFGDLQMFFMGFVITGFMIMASIVFIFFIPSDSGKNISLET